jgi:GT2 family glycosyltransferase
VTPYVSIVMPCHNRRDALALTLTEMGNQTYPSERFEVIVVDQASTDGSREVAQSLSTPYRLRLLPQDGKYGISVARNAGIREVAGGLVILLDADLVPHPGLIAAHVALHAACSAALGCGRVLAHEAANNSFIDRAAQPEAGLDRGDRAGLLPFWDAFGGHLSMSPESFRQTGPFDPLLKGYEDIDFAYRAERLGIAIMSCAEAIAYHNHPRTLQERCEQAQAYDRMVPVLLARYPELNGKLPFARDFEAIDLRRDGAFGVYRKLRVRLLAAAPVRAGFYSALLLLERHERFPRLAKSLYWRLMQANHYVGFREGEALEPAQGDAQTTVEYAG